MIAVLVVITIVGLALVLFGDLIGLLSGRRHADVETLSPCETPCSDAAGTCSRHCPHLRKDTST